MPKEYVAIKKAEMARGKSEGEAKRIAAATYVGRGKTAKIRRMRAKRLRKG